eukprot:NODE_918_length_1118_cov_40.302725_g876_i0.p2 GENE.NODE_918_length_1118_cov_40.302725_g876_i0~~NODE_918_length_1118_cov_40.302725_g876_i0.p2  ORF type:complete len:124 (-),score=23.98 NODE_918_length_1118_cov_40.302725_g876_i0:673-1044(-)
MTLGVLGALCLFPLVVAKGGGGGAGGSSGEGGPWWVGLIIAAGMIVFCLLICLALWAWQKYKDDDDTVSNLSGTINPYNSFTGGYGGGYGGGNRSPVYGYPLAQGWGGTAAPHPTPVTQGSWY